MSADREFSDVPIIMLTAKGEDMDKILGLEYGADDYITKPFNILEVKARIKAIMRRAGKNATQKTGKAKVVEAENYDWTVKAAEFIGEREINLTAKEFDVLELLVMNPNKVYSRENLLNIVWGYEYPGDVRTVDVHIRRLREKMKAIPANQNTYKWGVGYYYQMGCGILFSGVAIISQAKILADQIAANDYINKQNTESLWYS